MWKLNIHKVSINKTQDKQCNIEVTLMTFLFYLFIFSTFDLSLIGHKAKDNLFINCNKTENVQDKELRPITGVMTHPAQNKMIQDFGFTKTRLDF